MFINNWNIYSVCQQSQSFLCNTANFAYLYFVVVVNIVFILFWFLLTQLVVVIINKVCCRTHSKTFSFFNLIFINNTRSFWYTIVCICVSVYIYVWVLYFTAINNISLTCEIVVVVMVRRCYSCTVVVATFVVLYTYVCCCCNCVTFALILGRLVIYKSIFCAIASSFTYSYLFIIVLCPHFDAVVAFYWHCCCCCWSNIRKSVVRGSRSRQQTWQIAFVRHACNQCPVWHSVIAMQ